jgi:hypothetical protein
VRTVGAVLPFKKSRCRVGTCPRKSEDAKVIKTSQEFWIATGVHFRESGGRNDSLKEINPIAPIFKHLD